jgi:hypothetical protein
MLVAALACAAPLTAPAEESAATSATTATTAPPPASRFRDPDDGQFDVSTFLATPRAFLPVPVIITEPAIGYGGGLVGMFIRPRQKEGGEGYLKPNISLLGGFATENGTWGALAADSSRWMDDRVQTLAATGTGELHLDFYGLARRASRSMSR